ncbi:concanavalin A-like lectin/glucanase domain-containing protein [Polychytrium aggregatum]|uniref:concanavalin A-like lectin/glucanase domain-containing protein n=1 Tax=Polychytrium aggregatum TaxID=110093 RepID=UPI0022FEB984|nr:concanavalin A-like lectin/glucanase domain-containing protein [Polychytrium aggregatum]KAI9207014.1 concanavalin A-like lectin/glucanase domain-containing protein [Polychytrium aggregatum]
MPAYTLTDPFPKGLSFFDHFTFYQKKSTADGGFAAYENRTTATSLGLISADPATNAAIFRADSTSVFQAQSNPLGRPSIRLHSIDVISYALYIFDVAHAPSGCGTWPAIWFKKTTAQDPNASEIDIFETINERPSFAVGLYDNGNCYSSTSSFAQFHSGPSINCAVNIQNGSQGGCTAYNQFPAPASGPAFNQQGGGVYAMEFTPNTLNFWYFPRPSVPADVASGASSIDTTTWGAPYVDFRFDCCSPDTFLNLNIVFNINLCGSWVGGDSNAGQDGTCAGLWTDEASCNNYVAANPSALTEAYWSINALNVYQKAPEAFSPNTSVVCPAGAVATATISQASLTVGATVAPTTTTTKKSSATTTGSSKPTSAGFSATPQLLPLFVLLILLFKKLF